jgi:hypothetical protein
MEWVRELRGTVVTNDTDLPSLPGLRMIVLDDLLPKSGIQ